jgi:hypothetical protein
MRIGNIDGLGIIYDENGEIILGNNEKLVDKFKAKCAVIYKKDQKEFGYKSLFIRGEGTILLTNRRFVFIREPLSVLEIIDQHGAGGLHLSAKDIQKAKNIRQAKAKEYVSFDLYEISRINRAFLKWGILIRIGLEEYCVAVNKRTMDAIERIMKEENIQRRY